MTYAKNNFGANLENEDEEDIYEIIAVPKDKSAYAVKIR